ncbi:hypothetical protein [Neobacillus jeddahensis]|uniref:hypothetical protein n=1 Tax=Neobacillus jeddahensis TaxID=1461580 RepID=UPI00058D0DDD|nr:hypothetical protein [Neobacillus jeddahensis]
MTRSKGIFLLLLVFLLTIVTSGCDIVDGGKAAYKYKTAYVAMAGEDPTKIRSTMGTLFYLGERDITYHLMDGNKFMAQEYSATANLAYNLSYLVNTPAKLIHNIRYDYKMTQKDFKADEKVEQGIEDRIGNSLLDISMVLSIILDTFYALIGLVGSFIMLFLGTLIGLIAHPIDTILNIPSALVGLIKTVIAAVTNIFSWEQ